MKKHSEGWLVGKGALVGGICGLAVFSAGAYQPAAGYYVDLSDQADVGAQPVQQMAFKPSTGRGDAPVVEIKPDEILHSGLSGLGGAFNENGGEAFMSLPKAKRKAVAAALFNPETGAGLTLCRTAVGSSDFGLSAYSYSETPEDYAMKHFSVERDTTSVIPFILAAQAENPGLRIFASPWSPPGWMKENGRMDTTDAGPKKAKNPNDPNNVLKSDPKIYEAYALYFSRYVQAYAEHGVPVERILVQNETDMNPIYPGCNMLPEQMAELVSNHMRPRFKKDGVQAEIWAGTFRGKRGDAKTFMTLDAANDVDGVGMQYAAPAHLAYLTATYPELPLMHTEGKCWNGANSMKQARTRFGEVAMWLNGGCENYCYWNMVLNETSTSGWGWKQNSLVRIDRKTGDVIYTSDFAPIALLSRFIRPGDQLLKVETPNKNPAIAVANDERLVLFLENNSNEPAATGIRIGDETRSVEIPAHRLCAFVFKK